mmetsp:Transcript_90420/g.193864  ORF Transcript_90420/g.193864 Transcript_90420/m.193864 type:complete len:214 (-) Transcript_90420:670-1311(-)
MPNASSRPQLVLGLKNLDANAEVAGGFVNLLKPIGAEVVASVDGTLGEIVSERPLANAAHSEEEAQHLGAVEAIGLELQGPVQWALLDHGRVHALPLTAAHALDSLTRIGEDHEPEVRQGTGRKGRRDEGPAHGRLKLATEVLDLPLHTRAGRTSDLRGTNPDARRHLRDLADLVHLYGLRCALLQTRRRWQPLRSDCGGGRRRLRRLLTRGQ